MKCLYFNVCFCIYFTYKPEWHKFAVYFVLKVTDGMVYTGDCSIWFEGYKPSVTCINNNKPFDYTLLIELCQVVLVGLLTLMGLIIV